MEQVSCGTSTVAAGKAKMAAGWGSQTLASTGINHDRLEPFSFREGMPGNPNGQKGQDQGG